MISRSSFRSSAAAAAGLALAALSFAQGCAVPYETIDRGLAAEARLALFQRRPPPLEDEVIEEEPLVEEPKRSVIIAELLAIFPGIFWHGLGHQYAGDTETAREIRSVGEWGYLLTALGGGMVIGGYFLDKEDEHWDSTALSLYIAGGVTGGVGAGFFLSAWFYDMIDTPRAVEARGKPPRGGGLFHKDFEQFETGR